MSYEYEPIKGLEKEIEYVRHNYEKITHTHQKAVVGTQIKKLESRLHKFKQAAKVDEIKTINGILLGEMDTLKTNLNYYKKQADEYEAKAKAFDRITEEVKLTKFDIFEKELIDEDTGYLALGKELARFVTKYERIESDEV